MRPGTQGRTLSATATNTNETSIVCTCAAIAGNGDGVGGACCNSVCSGGVGGAVVGTDGAGETPLPLDSAGASA